MTKKTPGSGRKKGTPNKLTKTLKEAILAGLDTALPGGREEYFKRMALEQPGPFMALCSKLLPTELTGANNGPVTFTWKAPGGSMGGTAPDGTEHEIRTGVPRAGVDDVPSFDKEKPLIGGAIRAAARPGPESTAPAIAPAPIPPEPKPRIRPRPRLRNGVVGMVPRFDLD